LRDEGFEKDDSNSFSLAKPNTDGVDKVEKPKTIPSNQVETIWSVSKSVLQNYDASIYQIMWGFYLENPNAFIDEDINRVRGDIDLLLPSQELVTSTSAIAAKESIAFMDTRRTRTQEISIKPILKLTAPEVLYSDSESIKDSVNSSAPQSTPTSIIQIDNSDLNASEIVSKNTSIIELNSEANFSKNANNLSDSKGFDLRDLFWVALLSLVLGFSIAYMLIRSSKKPAFTRSAVEEDLQDEINTFQTNLSISNDIETQELDLVRTYIAMDDWDSAIIILDKLVATSTNNSIISEAQSLLKEKK
jgi:FimV-like protein